MSAHHLVLGVAGLILVFVGSTVPLRGQPDSPRYLTLEPVVASKLSLLAGGLHTEIVLCLEGTVRGDSALVTEFSMPEPRLSTFQRSRFMPCPSTSLAVWHNHPPVDFEPTLEGHGAKRPAPLRISRSLDLCALSGKDITTAARLGHLFTVVAVDAETWCWWTRDQVHQLVRRRMQQGRHVVGQGESAEW